MSEKNNSVQSPIAIVGIGCLFPKAENANRFWANIKNGVDAITDVPASHWLPEDYFDKNPKSPDRTYARRGGFILPVDFDPSEFGLAPNALEATDSAQLLGLLTAKMALQDAGYGPGRDFDRSRVSVILGVTGSLELVIPLGARLGHPKWRKALAEFGITGADSEAIIARMQEDYVPWQESSFPGLLGNVVAGRIANRFNLGGTNCVVDAACGSSLSAVHMASLELAAGRSSMVVTGGVDCFNDIFMYMCFSKTPALSASGDAKPFDASADGTALGEGLGMVALKRLEDAVKDGDRIYAVLKGVGSSSDGKGKAIYAPTPEGQARALRNAYSTSGISPDTIEMVEAHGTGTAIGDGVELDALTEVYGSGKEGAWCALGSVKSMIGHTKAAAGSAGIIKAALSLYNKTLPPSIKVTTPLKQLSSATTPFYLNADLRPWVKKDHPRRAAVSAMGFGGANFHAILEEHSAAKNQPDWDGDVQIAAFSGAGSEALKQQLNSWKGLSWDEVRINSMRSRAAFKAADPSRLTLVLERDKQDWDKIIDSALSSLDSQKANKSWATPDGVFFSSGAPEKLAVLFPGQGAQYPGMQRDIACRFPEALNTLTAADKEFGGNKRLSDFIYPHAAFTPAGKEQQAEELRDTRVAQPALGAASMGAYSVLAGFGLSPDAFAGHSYGELPALCAAGVFDIPSLFAMSKLRGSLMAQGAGDRGGMLAVQAPLAEVEKVINEEKLDLILANKNAPAQFVLSGRSEEIKRAAECFTARSLKNTALRVSAAFHSPLVAGAKKDFAAALGKIKFNKPGTRVYANKTADVYPDSADKAREILASQLASPVEFTAMVEKMYASGLRVFLEVGPGARLTGLAASILAGKEHTAFALDSSSGKRSGITDTARALARLASLGCSLNLAAWENGEAGVKDALEKKVSKLAVKLTGANYRSSRPAASPKKTVRPVQVLQAQSPAIQAPARNPAGLAFTSDALRIAQESMAALQKMQEQTALLHARFLEGQEAAQRSFQALVDQQQQLFSGAPAVQLPVFRPAPVTPSPIQTPALPAAPAAVSGGLNVEQVLLAIVSSQTGYPAESLNPDMDMESDLGIDSIKRVAILSELQERLPSAPRITPEQLGSIRTLRQVTAYISAGMPQAAAQPAASAAPAPVRAKSDDEITREILKTAAFNQTAPREKVELSSKLPLWITDDGSELATGIVKNLTERGYRAQKVSLTGPGTAAPDEGLAGLVILAPAARLEKKSLWGKDSEDFQKAAFRLTQIAGPALRAAGKKSGACLMTVSRLDGSFGISGLKAEQDPVFGGLAGLAKTAAHEWQEVSCRALDAASDWQHTVSVAQTVADELFFKGPAEMGISETGSKVVLLSSSEQVKGGKLQLGKSDVVLITGGARGVTAEAAAALAAACGPKLAILGRSPLPAAEENWLAGCPGEADIKKALISRNPGMAPKAAGEQCRQIMAAREIRTQLNRFEAAGSHAVYFSADIRDAQSVSDAIKKITDKLGPVRGFVHGAGVLADKLILDKTAEQFESVFDTKVSGLRNILTSLELPKLKFLALYSSSTARFGRTGQCDYAMANEVLNKTAQLIARRLPDCRTVSFNWGPWDGGMVNDGLKALFAKEGVGVIGLEPGGKFLVAELAANSGPVEVVAVARPRTAARPESPAAAGTTQAFEVSVSTEDYPFLRSHVINGKAVVPTAIISEWLAHGALHGNPGLLFHGFNNLKIYKGIILGAEALKLSVRAGKPSKKEGCFAVPAELRGPDGELHAGAEIILAASLPRPGTPGPEFALKPYPRAIEQAYGEILFHGEDMRFIRSVAGVSEKGIVIDASASLPPGSWLRRPLRDKWLADPAALDAAFQGMILWTFENSGACSLPNCAASYRQFAAYPANGVRVAARITRCSEHSAVADIDFTDSNGKLVARIEGYECTVDKALNAAFMKRTLGAVAA
ncbi:MAG: hypothetical protein AUJ51_01390 [Elusimicrobia bacterium CG1_02_56_21]|nr:MAG: hypothetical protein AUJ51_01390 [Elusimicrobia bacterium CG1_02_56_21]